MNGTEFLLDFFCFGCVFGNELSIIFLTTCLFVVDGNGGRWWLVLVLVSKKIVAPVDLIVESNFKYGVLNFRIKLFFFVGGCVCFDCWLLFSMFFLRER